MNEKIKQIIAEALMRQSYLKAHIKNLDSVGRLTDEKLSEILDEIQYFEELIQKLKKGL